MKNEELRRENYAATREVNCDETYFPLQVFSLLMRVVP
jgi:hypothetical protein